MQLPEEKPDDLACDDSIRRLLAPFTDFSRVGIERRVVYCARRGQMGKRLRSPRRRCGAGGECFGTWSATRRAAY